MTVQLAQIAFLMCSLMSATPIRLHPENPHYFLYQGRPTVLITSSEHYGSVINLDFNYHSYLDALRADELNLARVFSGTNREVSGSFGISENNLSPEPGRFVCPWARSTEPGASDGGQKFDLNQWDTTYLERLKNFIRAAGERGIIVELVFFCTMYDNKIWAASPMNALNNIQSVGKVGRNEVYSEKDPQLTQYQVALVRKLVMEFAHFDNLYYEICNEPYERPGLTKEWNDHIIATIVETERKLAVEHLIAQGIAVRSGKITAPSPHVSIFNFHAARPEAVTINYDLPQVFADDETGGRTSDREYRREAWRFMLAGGTVFDHLDFSFSCRDASGSQKPPRAPGGGGPVLRRQLSILKSFLEDLDLVQMRPDHSWVQGGSGIGNQATGNQATGNQATGEKTTGERVKDRTAKGGD